MRSHSHLWSISLRSDAFNSAILSVSSLVITQRLQLLSIQTKILCQWCTWSIPATSPYSDARTPSKSIAFNASWPICAPARKETHLISPWVSRNLRTTRKLIAYGNFQDYSTQSSPHNLWLFFSFNERSKGKRKRKGEGSEVRQKTGFVFFFVYHLPPPGALICAQFTDRLWYRARVRTVKGAERPGLPPAPKGAVAFVEYVDFGNYDWVFEKKWACPAVV